MSAFRILTRLFLVLILILCGSVVIFLIARPKDLELVLSWIGDRGMNTILFHIYIISHILPMEKKVSWDI